MAVFADRRVLTDVVLTALVGAQKQRHKRDDWEKFERDVMVAAANGWAVRRNYPVITAADVEAIEHRALGHVDYSRKIALYIAELVIAKKVLA